MNWVQSLYKYEILSKQNTRMCLYYFINVLIYEAYNHKSFFGLEMALLSIGS